MPSKHWSRQKAKRVLAPAYGGIRKGRAKKVPEWKPKPRIFKPAKPATVGDIAIVHIEAKED